jgi:cell division protease FtsH
MIEEQYQRAISILNKHKDKLTELATVLLDKEVIFKDNLQKIFGDRPYSKLETNAIKDATNNVDSEIIKDDKSESILKEKKNKL